MRMFRIALSLPFGRRIFRRLFFVDNPRLERRVLGLNFKNPVGLAAGFDKDGKYFEDLTALGFGFIEIGTVTPRPQDGNPQPRLFRLPEDEALINRMGFNNEGVGAMAERLRQKRQNTEGVIIGGNIGKNKLTANEDAAKDYNYCFETLFEYVDYFVVNVSSPNTPNLRALQDREPLTALLKGLQDLNQKKPNSKPILLKIAPDLTDTQLDDILDIVKETKLSGLHGGKRRNRSTHFARKETGRGYQRYSHARWLWPRAARQGKRKAARPARHHHDGVFRPRQRRLRLSGRCV